jgi:hypothetical protein
MLITTSVYIGSSIYSPAIADAAEYFGVSEIVSVLGLSLFGTFLLFWYDVYMDLEESGVWV